MQPRTVLDSFTTPEGHELALVQRGTDFFIDLDRQELMSTRRTGSEIALAEMGCEAVRGVTRPAMLIGGLGLGFTLRAALAGLPAKSRLVVAELFPRVVRWNYTYLAHLSAGSEKDRRLEIRVRDVWDEIPKGPWDAILLDTDNGPEAFCLEHNNRLYSDRGLARLHDGLAPGGTLLVWAADIQRSFVKTMMTAGFDTRCVTAREHRNRGQRYAIYVGRKP